MNKSEIKPSLWKWFLGSALSVSLVFFFDWAIWYIPLVLAMEAAHFFIYFETIEISDSGLSVRRIGRGFYIPHEKILRAKRSRINYSINLVYLGGRLHFMPTGYYGREEVRVVMEWLKKASEYSVNTEASKP